MSKLIRSAVALRIFTGFTLGVTAMLMFPPVEKAPATYAPGSTPTLAPLV